MTENHESFNCLHSTHIHRPSLQPIFKKSSLYKDIMSIVFFSNLKKKPQDSGSLITVTLSVIPGRWLQPSPAPWPLNSRFAGGRGRRGGPAHPALPTLVIYTQPLNEDALCFH